MQRPRFFACTVTNKKTIGKPQACLGNDGVGACASREVRLQNLQLFFERELVGALDVVGVHLISA